MSESTLNIALKEWSATINALASGDQIFLLRKGGIREPNRRFELPARRFLLYPTQFHEADRLLKPEFHQLLDADRSSSKDQVVFRAWAEVAEVVPIDSAEHFASLSGHHVWTEEFIAKRIAWKPRHAADLIILRTHRLDSPSTMTVEPYHRGCKSWVDVDPPIDAARSTPALPNRDWEHRVREISSLLSPITAGTVTAT